MKKLTNTESMNINGGKTYKCIDCSYKSSSFWKVYGHCLSKLHFKKHKGLNACFAAGGWCLTNGLTNGLSSVLNAIAK